MKVVRMLMSVVGALAIVAPVVAWATFKPVRILAPSWNNVTCASRVCVEDQSKLKQAIELQAKAMAEVGRKLSPLEQEPLTVFCSTRRCYRSFGGGMERGATILNWGVILPPESWVSHIVEHEYIHMLQAQQLGLLGRERTPDWFKEGMPFLISAPPAHDLPEYARPHADRYGAWEHKIGRENVWRAVRNQ